MNDAILRADRCLCIVILIQSSNRYKLHSVLSNIGEDKLFELLKNLEDSKTVLFSYHSNGPNVGMSLTKDISKFKIYCADTGLFITLAFWTKTTRRT